MYLGIDQYGQMYRIKKHPRKELSEMLGATHIDKVFIDTPSGSKHVGYVMARLWITVYKLSEWK